MKKTITTLLSTCMVLVFTGVALGAVDSLRGGTDIPQGSLTPVEGKQMVVKGGIERSYRQQPPVIPHETEKDEINLKVNTCMNCHSEKTYEQKKAPKIGESHFVDREGKKLETLSSRRYFCNQCHAPQINAEPLVENNFQGIK